MKNNSQTEPEKTLSETASLRALVFKGKPMTNSKMKRLIEKRDAVNARLKQEQNKVRADERRCDTRRKVLAGATVLEWAKRESEFSSRLLAELESFLVRDQDRELFGLPPLRKPQE